MAVEWTSIVSVGIAASALSLSVVNFVQAREPRVKWKLVDDGAGRSSVLIVNTSTRNAASITDLFDPDADEDFKRVRFQGTPPFHVEPGSSFRFTLQRYASGVPARVTVKWRQKRWFGERSFEATYYR